MISTTTFEKYVKKIKSGYFKPALKVEWLNPDETVNFEFTNALYNIDVNVNVNNNSGCRRTCTITINNDKNKFPINFNNIWIGQKFKVWMGIYIDDKTPCYFPQGVFYVSNPDEVYNPHTRTVTLNGIDKWAYLDGTLFGYLSGTHTTSVGVNLYNALRELLKTPIKTFKHIIEENTIKISNFNETISSDYYKNYDGGGYNTKHKLIAGATYRVSFNYKINSTNKTLQTSFGYGDTGYTKDISFHTWSVQTTGVTAKFDATFTAPSAADGLNLWIRFSRAQAVGTWNVDLSNIEIHEEAFDIKNEAIDPISPLLSNYFITKTTVVNGANKSVLECPYTATVERGGTYADIILEYATILCACVYYDVNGRLVLEPMIDTADDITDTNKEILWNYSVDERTFLGLTQTYNFDKVYNDFIVLGNITNGYQSKGRVQNRNPMSNTCVQKIGLKTKEPYEDNQYVSDEQCVELAKYYAKTDTILQKSANIESIVLYHFDVNKLVSVSTPNNNMSKELFLITGFSLSTSGKMSVNVTSVNILKDFSVVEV